MQPTPESRAALTAELTTVWRGEFPGLEVATNLNTCSLGQLSNRSRAAMNRYMDLWTRYGASAWYEIWMGELAATRARFARLINAQPHEIAILPSVGVALSVIASSLDYSARPEVVLTELDFPTLPYQWMARTRQGAQPRLLASPDRVHVPPQDYAAAIGPQTALVATTHVFFTSGWVQDIQTIAQQAHEQGARCLIDGYQAAGQIPVDVKAAGVDIYISGGLKWLLGGPGVVYMYVREELIEQLHPTTTGWFAAENMFHFNRERFDYAADARRFEPGTPAVAAVYAGNAGLSIIEEIGPAAIQARTAQLVADLVQRLRAAGIEPRLPAAMAQHAGIVTVPVEQPATLVKRLAQEHNIIIDYRPETQPNPSGHTASDPVPRGVLRLSPYFYNTEAENARVVEALYTLT